MVSVLTVALSYCLQSDVTGVMERKSDCELGLDSFPG